ncbi:hypothetical protein BGZ63DRAFT_468184 [Mariannaea sp. PMI_226]|nr:hypothetical protein BGZ63DRAFT_468184 [Mariannaea sp. PMI_226]
MATFTFLPLEVAVATHPTEIQKERIVIGGKLLSPASPEEDNDIIWPPGSEQLMKKISLVCRESRQVVIYMFPDLIRIEQPERQFLNDPPLDHEQCSNCPWWHRWWNSWPKHRLIRCNLQTDFVSFDKIAHKQWIFEDEVQYAHAINECLKATPYTGVRVEDFLSVLRRIRHIIIDSPWEEGALPISPNLQTTTCFLLEEMCKNVIAGASNITSLSICRSAPPPWLSEERQRHWETMFSLLPFSQIDILHDNRFLPIQGLFEDVIHRFLGEAYRNLSPTKLFDIFRTARQVWLRKRGSEPFDEILRGKLRTYGTWVVSKELQKRDVILDPRSDSVVAGTMTYWKEGKSRKMPLSNNTTDTINMIKYGAFDQLNTFIYTDAFNSIYFP